MFNQSLKVLTVLIFVFLITACAGPMTKNELASVKKIAVLNSFPETPNYLKIGTTVFQNDTENIDSLKFKSVVTDQIRDYLVAKGYQVSEVNDKTQLQSGEVDMIIEAVPRDAMSKDYTNGYGFYQRFFFGTKTPASSYVALNLVPSKKDSSNLFSAYYKESFKKLDVDELPTHWNDLTDKQKEDFAQNLKLNIQTTIKELIETLGL